MRKACPVFVAAGLIVAGWAAAACACSTPVFRYALECWRADALPLIVFHKGPLTARQNRVVEFLRLAGSDGKANVAVETVDLAGQVHPQLQQMWEQQADRDQPSAGMEIAAFELPVPPLAGLAPQSQSATSPQTQPATRPETLPGGMADDIARQGQVGTLGEPADLQEALTANPPPAPSPATLPITATSRPPKPVDNVLANIVIITVLGLVVLGLFAAAMAIRRPRAR